MAFRIISRQEWGARAPRVVNRMRLPAPRTWVHHTGSPASSNEHLEMRSIQRFHMDTRRWNDIAYSFVTFPTGNIYEGRGWGVVGAHTPGQNSTSHGLCIAGHYGQEFPLLESLDANRWLIDQGIKQGFITPGTHPTGGHRDVSATECPGNNLYAQLNYLRMPWEDQVPNHEPPRLNGRIFHIEFVYDTEGHCRGWYYVSVLGEIHAHGDPDFVRFHGVSSAPA